MQKYWREAVIFILAIILAFFVGRGYESRFTEGIIRQNQTWGKMISQTEQIVSQVPDRATRETFRRIGYNIPVLREREVQQEKAEDKK